MSFFQPKFMGLSVRDIKTSLGFNQQASQLTVQLVEDTIYGDLYDGTAVGSPVYFEFSNFTFAGLLQSFKKSNSTSGLPVYDVTIVDPREILDGAQVITSAYTGVVPGGIKNIFNVYGYWESLGFGTSNSTQAGIPWDKVYNAILAMANNPVQGAYGGPLQYKGFAYSLDLSEVPHPPGYYRLPSGYLSLLEVIHLLCEDSGCDFYVCLVGTTIKIKVVSRFFQPPLGTITALALSNTYSGSTITAEAGIESRNEVGSILLIGGEKTGIYITETIYSYWGTDINGLPVIGEAGTLGTFGACEFANLNAADCSDIVGSTTYRCSTIEMRFALWDVAIWMAFLAKHRTDIAAFVGAGIYGDTGITVPKFAPDLVQDDATKMGLAVDEVLADRRARLFDLVHRYAEDFYGKQFLVTVDGVQATQDAETGQITTSLEPTNAGYMEFGAAGLGVPINRLDVLQESDERVVSFAYYSSIIGADLSRINWSETAVDNTGKMWVRTQTDSRILFVGTTPYIHVRLGGALYEPKDDQFGNADDAGRNFAPISGNNLKALDNNAFGGTVGYIGIHPAPRIPTALGIPLKSNIETYGPWFIAGSAGKVRVEQDTSLTPWDYGSATVMDFAGQARIASTYTNQTLSESGGLQIAGAPGYSLGDTMAAGGPNLTNLEIAFGPSGISTSYRWQTFTAKFGLFSRQNSERLRRVSLAQVQTRRDFRKALNRAIVANTIIDKAIKGAKFNKAFWEKKQSPSTVIMTMGATDGSDTRVGCGFETYEASLAMLNQGTNYADKAIMSVSGLVRGFSTNPSATTKLSKYPTIGSFSGTNNPLILTDLNPFQSGSDVEVLTWGDTYAGANAYRRGNTTNNTRAAALRGPLVLTGWGVGTDGNKYPSGGGSYSANYLKRSDLWKTGIVDLIWDDKRGCWTSHDLLTGVTSGSTASGATGTVKVGNDSGWTVSVYNQWSSTIATTKKCIVGWCVNEQKWHFVSVDC